MEQNIKVTVNCLNQHAMAFQRNCANIFASIENAVTTNSNIRCGLPLETIGLSSGDHFKERDTVDSCWDIISKVILKNYPCHLLIEIGMPVIKDNDIYNCFVYVRNNKIELIRPKTCFQASGLQSDAALFSFYKGDLAKYTLPDIIQNITNQDEGDFGVKHIDLNGGKYISVFAEEVDSTEIWALIDKSDIVNFIKPRVYELHQHKIFIEYMRTLTAKKSAIFLNSTFSGCDGTTLLFESGAYISYKNDVKELLPRFSYNAVDSYTLDMHLDNGRLVPKVDSLESVEDSIKDEPWELLEAMAGYLWAQMVKTTACGFFIPLSGGADSSTTACAVYKMCKRIYNSDSEVKRLFCELIGHSEFDFETPEALVNRILFTAYMPMVFSGKTKAYSADLAARLRSNHFEIPIQKVYESIKDLAESIFDTRLNFEGQGGSLREDLALQGIQARSRLVISYISSQVIPVKYKLKSFLIVMGTGNCSEVVRGYYSRYDNSSGDVNVIGSLVKRHIKDILNYFADTEDGFGLLKYIADIAPTAELKPTEINAEEQTDESDMGFSYEELDFLTEEYKVHKKGFDQLLAAFDEKFKNKYNKGQIIMKVQWFYRCLLRYRYKCLTLPPSVHLTAYDLNSINDSRPGFYDNRDLDFKPRD